MYIYAEVTENGVVKYPRHKHMHWEVMYYIEGEGYMYSETGNISFEPGCIIIVPPGIEHGSVSNSGFKNISVAGNFGHMLSFDSMVMLKDIVSKEGEIIANLILNNRHGSLVYLDSLCNAYLQFIMQNINIGSNIRNVVNTIINKINENAYDNEINLRDILLESGYAEDYIRACFKKNVGVTPNEFLTKIRIDHACALINIYGKSVPLSEIAEQCGYLDYVYFSRKFKSVMDTSPKNYLMSILKQ